jgi:hypothetical protein
MPAPGKQSSARCPRFLIFLFHAVIRLMLRT